MTSTSGESTDQFLWEVHKYTNEYIRFADTKAAFIAGTSTALIGYLVSSSIFDSCLRKTPCAWSKLQYLGFAGLLLLTATFVLSVVAIRPRLWNKTSVGFIFWDSVAGHGSHQPFSHAVRELTAQARTTALSEHLFVLATVAKRKYTYVSWATNAGIAGGVLAGFVLFLQHALRQVS
jgi:hypothetical protein